jgi:Proteasome subunit
LSFVDLLGTTYSASTLATGYGAHIAQPLLRKSVEGREDTLTEEEAHKIIQNSMRVLYYRDARSINKVNYFILSTYTQNINILGFSIKWPRSPIQVLTFPNRNSWKRHGLLQRVFEGTVLKLSNSFCSPSRCKKYRLLQFMDILDFPSIIGLEADIETFLRTLPRRKTNIRPERLVNLLP